MDAPAPLTRREIAQICLRCLVFGALSGFYFRADQQKLLWLSVLARMVVLSCAATVTPQVIELASSGRKWRVAAYVAFFLVVCAIALVTGPLFDKGTIRVPAFCLGLSVSLMVGTLAVSVLGRKWPARFFKPKPLEN